MYNLEGFITADELASRWLLKPDTIRGWAKAGKIPGATKLGRVWRFKASKADEMVKVIEPEKESFIRRF